MELKDTAKLMIDSDYKERFKAEYYQLKIRITKLEYIIKMYNSKKLNIHLPCPKSLYELQLRAMKDYLAILDTRSIIENIKLS